MLRIGVAGSAPPEYVTSLREAGVEVLVLNAPTRSPRAVALRREWIADWVGMSLLENSLGQELDTLLVSGSEAAELAGWLIAGLRLDIPVVVAAPSTSPFSGALAALGFAPIEKDPVEVAVATAQDAGPRSVDLVEDFSLANALRTGLALGGDPELLVHLAAIARETGTDGFSQMIRVLAPESPKLVDPNSPWFEKHGVAGVLAHLGDSLHDTLTVTGWLEEDLPPEPPALEIDDGPRLVFVRGRASGTELLCRTDGETSQISGYCRFFRREEEAVEAVESEGAIASSDLLVVGGCGPRGGPGLLRLDKLGHALAEAKLAVPVLTDGLPPENVVGPWASLATPEAAVGGILWRLRDGDFLRIDIQRGVIRTGARIEELPEKETLAVSPPSGSDYAARYARTVLPALEGAGFE